MPFKVPADRVAAVLSRAMFEDDCSARELSKRVKVSDHTILRIVRGDRQHVEPDTVDRILVGLGLVHLWHLDPPEGFADVYCHKQASA